MRSAKAGLCPETYLGSVAQQIYRDVASRYGGEKIKSQIRSVAQVLGVKHDLAVRARKGRLGARAFPKWWEAYRKWDAEQREIGNLEWRDLDLRVARLETLVGRGNLETAGEASKLGPRPRMGAPAA